MSGGSGSVYLWVAAGSGAGSALRHAVGLLEPAAGGPGWPWATLAVNLVGCCAIGFVATLSGPDGRWLLSAGARQGIMVGFCGGLTTFSAFSLEGVLLLHVHEFVEALAYVMVSLIGWLLATWLGQVAALRLIRRGG